MRQIRKQISLNVGTEGDTLFRHFGFPHRRIAASVVCIMLSPFLSNSLFAIGVQFGRVLPTVVLCVPHDRVSVFFVYPPCIYDLFTRTCGWIYHCFVFSNARHSYFLRESGGNEDSEGATLVVNWVSHLVVTGSSIPASNDE